MKIEGYIGLNLCFLIPYYYGYMSGYELLATFIGLPFCIAFWSIYAVIMKEINNK